MEQLDGQNLMRPNPSDDIRLEHAMGRLLQVGVLLSAAVMMAGGGLYLIGHGREIPDFRHFHPSAAHGWQAMRIGILIMIATPVLRVAFAVAAFARERDRLYTVVSLIVLGLLAWSFRGVI